METIEYENKAEKRTVKEREPRSTVPSGKKKVEVIKAHDGIKKGIIFLKPEKIADMMIRKGYYKEVE